MDEEQNLTMAAAVRRITEAEELVRKCFEQHEENQVAVVGETDIHMGPSSVFKLRQGVSTTFARASLREAGRTIREASKELNQVASKLA